jgi:hypothetical protein
LKIWKEPTSGCTFYTIEKENFKLWSKGKEMRNCFKCDILFETAAIRCKNQEVSTHLNFWVIRTFVEKWSFKRITFGKCTENMKILWTARVWGLDPQISGILEMFAPS